LVFACKPDQVTVLFGGAGIGGLLASKLARHGSAALAFEVFRDQRANAMESSPQRQEVGQENDRERRHAVRQKSD
jgi:patatin-like phospholipase/acyl hydrolase